MTAAEAASAEVIQIVGLPAGAAGVAKLADAPGLGPGGVKPV